MDQDNYWHKFTQDSINSMESYTRLKCNLPNFKVAVKKIDWSAKRVTSKGGDYWYEGDLHPGLSIAMAVIFRHIEDGHFPEYLEYSQNIAVGDFWTTDIALHIKATVAHEMAHAIQSHLNIDVDHDQTFLEYYGILRNKYVNPFLNFVNFYPLKQSYERKAA